MSVHTAQTSLCLVVVVVVGSGISLLVGVPWHQLILRIFVVKTALHFPNTSTSVSWQQAH
jgi:hypothetical protein